MMVSDISGLAGVISEERSKRGHPGDVQCNSVGEDYCRSGNQVTGLLDVVEVLRDGKEP